MQQSTTVTNSTGIWCDLDQTGLWGIQVGSQKYPAIYARPSEARAALRAMGAATSPAAPSSATTISPTDNESVAALPLDDPTIPFGVLGGPSPECPVTQAELDAALAHVLAFYESSPLDAAGLIKRAHKARAVLRQPEGWAIRPDGSFEVRGSNDWYLVADAEYPCVLRDRQTKKGGVRPCPDALFRGGTTGNTCYHQFCRELVRLAQVLSAPVPRMPLTQPNPPPPLVVTDDFAGEEVAAPHVEITIPAELFVRAWDLIACTEMSAQVAINGDALILLAGGVHIILTGQGMGGHADTELPVSTIRRAQPDIDCVSRADPPTSIGVMFDSVAGALLVLSHEGRIVTVLN